MCRLNGSRKIAHASMSSGSIAKACCPVGASARLQTAHGGSQLATREAGKIEIDGNQVRVSWHKSLPLPVFVCPLCERDCYRIYEASGVWACRKCHGLD